MSTSIQIMSAKSRLADSSAFEVARTTPPTPPQRRMRLTPAGARRLLPRARRCRLELRQALATLRRLGIGSPDQQWR
jgi:hypothetical protein